MNSFMFVFMLLANSLAFSQSVQVSDKLLKNTNQNTKAVVDKDPVRVRIGLKLVPYSKVYTKSTNGTQKVSHVKAEASSHTLRARLDKVNHFYLNDWHIESKPVSWIRNTKRYEVQLTFFQRYGAYGKLEKRVGALKLNGNLHKQHENIYVLSGVAKKRFNDKFGAPVLDVISGYGSMPIAKAPAEKKLKSTM